jgi:hypothetical protein
MANQLRLAHFPNEVLDMIFEQLSGETATLRIFLYDPGTYLSAAQILWRDVDVSYRKTYRKDQAFRNRLLHDFDGHPYYRLMHQLNPLRLTTVRSLKVDIPVRPCGCPSSIQGLVEITLAKLPKLRTLDIACFRVPDFVGQTKADHAHTVQYLHLPSHVRELTINHPRIVRWSPADTADGAGLDQLTFRSDCVNCESHSATWHVATINLDKTHNIFRNVKKFRFECPSTGMCQDPEFQTIYCHHTSPRMLQTIMRSLSSGSLESLIAVDVEMKLRIRSARDRLQDLFPGINGFQNLKHVGTKIQMI